MYDFHVHSHFSSDSAASSALQITMIWNIKARKSALNFPMMTILRRLTDSRHIPLKILKYIPDWSWGCSLT